MVSGKISAIPGMKNSRMQDGKRIEDRLNVSRGLLRDAQRSCQEMKILDASIKQVISETRRSLSAGTHRYQHPPSAVPNPTNHTTEPTTKPKPVGWDLELDIDLT